MKHGTFWLHCITPLHNGMGQGLGHVDRPIIREVSTQYPFLQSSTIKGAALALSSRDNGWDNLRDLVFGKGGTDGGQGRLSITDAQLLLLPVQSLAGTFAWVTSLFALARFRQLLGGCGGDIVRALDAFLVDPPSPGPEQACGAECRDGAGTLILDDSVVRLNRNGPYCIANLVLQPERNAAKRQALGALSVNLAGTLFPDSPFWRCFFCSRLLLVDDDAFTMLLSKATEIEANIRIGENGVTEDGSLRYTEYLPAESVLASYWNLDDYRLKEEQTGDIQQKLASLLGGAGGIQFGADETKGKGICRARWLPLEAVSASSGEK